MYIGIVLRIGIGILYIVPAIACSLYIYQYSTTLYILWHCCNKNTTMIIIIKYRIKRTNRFLYWYILYLGIIIVIHVYLCSNSPRAMYTIGPVEIITCDSPPQFDQLGPRSGILIATHTNIIYNMYMYIIYW